MDAASKNCCSASVPPCSKNTGAPLGIPRNLLRFFQSRFSVGLVATALGLLGVFHAPGFADYGDANLAGVRQFIFNLSGEVSGELDALGII